MAAVCLMLPHVSDMYAWHPPELISRSISTEATTSTHAADEAGSYFCENAGLSTTEPLFRRWTVDGTPMSPDRELVVGLRGALQDAGLSSYSDAAEKWCLEMGAAFVSEVLDELDDLVEAILGPADSAREAQVAHLRAALLAQSSGDHGTAESTAGGEPTIGTLLAHKAMVFPHQRMLASTRASDADRAEGMDDVLRGFSNSTLKAHLDTRVSSMLQEEENEDDECELLQMPLENAVKRKW